MSENYGVDYFASLPVADRRAPLGDQKTAWRTIVDAGEIHEFELGPHHDDVIRMRKMYRAALDQAVDDLCMTPANADDEFYKAVAVEWFKGHVTHGSSTSDFTNTCDLADLDPAWVRRVINKIIAERNKPHD